MAVYMLTYLRKAVVLSLSLLLAWLAWPSVAASETYYVHPDGLDSRQLWDSQPGRRLCGGAGCARRTLKGGSGCLLSGDTLIVNEAVPIPTSALARITRPIWWRCPPARQARSPPCRPPQGKT